MKNLQRIKKNKFFKLILIIVVLNFALFSLILPHNDSFSNTVIILQSNPPYSPQSACYHKILDPFEIDEMGPNDWKWAKDSGFCYGQGTFDCPYVIEWAIIDANQSGSCITIKNSIAHFKIRNCNFSGVRERYYPYDSRRSASAIELQNVSSGNIECNNFNSDPTLEWWQNGVGISMSQACENNRISKNNIIAYYDGIEIKNCSGNIICYNKISSNWRNGIYMYDCDNNFLKNNDILVTDMYRDYFGHGIYLENSENNAIIENNINENDGYGLFLENNCNNNVISENRVNSNVFGGLKLNSNCHKNIISNNEFNNNHGVGITCLYRCTSNKIIGNEVSNNREGFYMRDKSNKNLLSHNNITNNEYRGIYWYDSDNIKLSSNYMINNGEYALYLLGCVNATVSGNVANNNDKRGIYLWNCDNVNVSGNTASNNGMHGIYLLGCDNSTVSGNMASNDAQYGIMISMCYNGLLYDNKMFECGLCVGGSIEVYSSYKINTSNKVNEKPIYYYVNKTGLKSNDFYNAGQIILIECNDSQISQINASNTSIGITLWGCSNIKILECILNKNRFYGIKVLDSSSNMIIGNIMEDNREDGIQLQNSPGNILRNNKIWNGGLEIYQWEPLDNLRSNIIDVSNQVNEKPLYYYVDKINLEPTAFQNAGQIFLINCNKCEVSGINTFNTSTGIFMSASSNNNIHDNALNYHRISGLILYNSSNNNISHNIITNNTKTGINMISYSSNNLVFNNMISNNGDRGVYIYYECLNNVILRNYIMHNQNEGIYLSSCKSNSLLQNKIAYNKRDGIQISANANNFLENNVSFNGNNGMNFEYGENNKFIRNTVNDNILSGISLYYSNNNYVSENKISNNSNGIQIYYQSANNIISKNDVYSNKHSGIYLSNNACNTTVIGNTIRFNSHSGIYLTNVIDSVFLKNTVNNNSGYGFYVNWFSMKNNFSDNEVKYNNFDGILIGDQNSNNNTYLRNIIMGNMRNGIYINGYAYYNQIEQNMICENQENGIFIYNGRENSILSNTIKKNKNHGIIIIGNSYKNVMFLNIFVENRVNAVDNGSFDQWNDEPLVNFWDNGSMGNFWDDYEGIDNNGDGIGDTPYQIKGSVGSRDMCPLMDEKSEMVVDFIVNATDVFSGQWIQFSFTGFIVGSNISFNWEFGDGTISNEKNPTHQFMTPGNFVVKLSIIDAWNKVYSKESIVVVIELSRSDSYNNDTFKTTTPNGLIALIVSLLAMVGIISTVQIVNKRK